MPVNNFSTMFKSKEAQVWQRVLCVDPGVGGTGLAFWPKLFRWKPKMYEREVVHPQPPEYTGVVKPPRAGTDQTWMSRATDSVLAFGSTIKLLDPCYVIIEFVELWDGSEKSQAAAKTGSSFKLACLIGMMIWEVRTQLNVSPVLVKPQEWKGQLKKPIVHKRIFRALGEKYPEHTADAVGIGLAIQKVL